MTSTPPSADASRYLESLMRAAQDAMKQLDDALASAAGVRGKDAKPSNPSASLRAGAAPQSVEDALSDDLNTPLAISAIHQLGDPASLRAGANALGLLQQDAEAWFRWTPAGSSGPTDAEIGRASCRERV